ncbi:MAG: tRNA (N6-isopentenyl adenosine(37)-C2)-methylthiotransferase MiaB [Lachnospiraceae bacterium]|jgi:tRNA-2-methylthio-N6-dimethylallyladenosine synthase
MHSIDEDIRRNILSNAPDTEPERQFYYIDECKRIIKNISINRGRPLTCCINTFGCQMNAKDSEKLLGILQAIGYEITKSEDADFVLYNTCTVREHANIRVYGRLGVLKRAKENNPEMIIAMCGCMMQEPHIVEIIRQKYSHVNIIFGTHNIYMLAELLFLHLTDGKNRTCLLDGTDMVVENLPSVRKYPFKSGVNIIYGCNNFCSYCIVPYVRGRERSREMPDILAEIRSLSADGVVEVMLLGQNVNSYAYGFPRLLEETCKVDGIERIRFMTPHPKNFSDELIDVIKNNGKICRHIHLPLQSGSSRILEMMNRKYDKEAYLELAGKIRREIPEISITTDIIVGFPGETEEDFCRTLEVVEEVKFDSAFTFIYSRRSNTLAADMPGQVSKDVASERMERLLKLCSEQAGIRNARLKGRVFEVLVEEINSKDSRLLTGRLSNNSMVHFPGEASLVGNFVKVRLDEAKGFYYFGTLFTDEDNIKSKLI